MKRYNNNLTKQINEVNMQYSKFLVEIKEK